MIEGPAAEMLVDDFDFELPDDLIAQVPLEQRDASRLLVLSRTSGGVDHRAMAELPKLLRPGDLLVANNTRVLSARLRGKKVSTGAAVEFLLLRRSATGDWRALAKPTKKLAAGSLVTLIDRGGSSSASAVVEIREIGPRGEVVIGFPHGEPDLHEFGEAPLPPYIHTRLEDDERYQTTYATVEGSAAAPTAGLHFTPALRSRLTDAGIGWAEVTLHVGLDTFRPVTVDRIAEHRIHQEWCEMPAETMCAISETRARGGRVIAVGTTSARTIEFVANQPAGLESNGFVGLADLFVTPGYSWKVVDGMLTNFHLPRSTLLMMVSALAGLDPIRKAYQAAIDERYRFFSFGDAMLII